MRRVSDGSTTAVDCRDFGPGKATIASVVSFGSDPGPIAITLDADRLTLTAASKRLVFERIGPRADAATAAMPGGLWELAAGPLYDSAEPKTITIDNVKNEIAIAASCGALITTFETQGSRFNPFGGRLDGTGDCTDRDLALTRKLEKVTTFETKPDELLLYGNGFVLRFTHAG
jgi:hypothetical protein